MTDLDTVMEQERQLVLEHFDEEVALAIGNFAYQNAVENSFAIVIDIRTWDRQILFLSRPGTSASNAGWVRRKSNTVRRFQRSTYRLALERGGEGVFPPQAGADPADYVIAGGGFPLRVASAGIIGCLTISGLSGRADHEVAVTAVASHLGVDAKQLAFATN
jgi:uncharacterized protein (UPF0303 family)